MLHKKHTTTFIVTAGILLIAIILLVISIFKDEKSKMKYFAFPTDLIYTANFIREGGRSYLHGKVYERNSDGIALVELNYIRDTLQGWQKTRHENGVLSSLFFCKDDKKEGLYKAFYENGALMMERIYKNDHPVFEEKWYYDNGFLEQYNFYDFKGNLVSVIKFNRAGIITQRTGLLLHTVVLSNKAEIDEKYRFYCMYGTIPNTLKTFEFFYANKSVGSRKFKTKNQNLLRVDEFDYSKGNNHLTVVIKYKFNSKYHNQTIIDSTHLDFAAF